MSMKKRGLAGLWFLIELVAGIFAGGLLAFAALDLFTGTAHQKLNVAKLIATQIHALSSIPGDAYITNNNLHGFSIEITDNKIEVFEEDSQLIKTTYYFTKAGDSGINFKLKNSEDSSQIVISKINNKIIISEVVPTLS